MRRRRGCSISSARPTRKPIRSLFRLAMKMATGSGKTTVMAMLIAWQTVNAARKDSKDFSRAFLIVTPGITIRDRLRVLLPSEPDNYYETRELVPPEMLPRSPPRRDRDHQLPRLPAPGDLGAAQGRAQLPAGQRARADQDRGDRCGDAGARLRQAAQLRPRQRHQRRGASLLPAQGRRRRRGRADGRGEGRKRPRTRRPPASGSTASRRSTANCRRACAPSTTSPPRPSSCAARAIPKAISSPGSCPISA